MLLLSLIACGDGAASTANKAGTPRDARSVDARDAIDGSSNVPQTAEPDAGANMGHPAAGSDDAGGHAGNHDGGDHDAGDHDAGMPAHPIDICGTRVSLDDYTGRGHEWIFDVATIAANTDTNAVGASGLEPNLVDPSKDTRFPWIVRPANCSKSECYDQDAYADLVFADSDTRHALLSSIPYSIGADGDDGDPGGFAATTNNDMFDLQQKLNAGLGATRVHMALMVAPNDRTDLQLANMTARVNRVIAWYTDPAWGPAVGYFLSDDSGTQMIERGLDLGLPIFLVPKGMPYNGADVTFANPRDIGPVAARYPAARLVVLHSAFEHGFEVGANSQPTGDAADEARWGEGSGPWPEGPYDESDADVQADYPLTRGVNSLIKSLRDAGIEPNQNVYAGLDGVWAELITRPREAAHVLGKLLLYVGEDNILWGTRSVLFYGGPQPQIEAFRDFEIPADMRTKFGYPELTAERKAKILGLNAARLFCIQPQ